MASRGGSWTVWSARVTVSWSTTSRATVLPSPLRRRVTLILPVAVAMGSRARGLASLRIWSLTGPAGRFSASLGRPDRQPGTGCSAWSASSLVSRRRPPRFWCSYSRTRPARFSRQSKVSSQVCWRAPLPGAPGSVTTPNAWPSASRTADTGSCDPMSAVSPSSSNPRRSGVMCSRSPRENVTPRSPVLGIHRPQDPGYAGGGQDVRGAGHGGLGAVAGDGGGARGGGGSECFRGPDASRERDGERADERVPRPHGVDRGDLESFDGVRAVRGFCAGQGGAVGARGDHGVAGTV